jgi:hypothetical protein
MVRPGELANVFQRGVGTTHLVEHRPEHPFVRTIRRQP